jgi:hypothetical protein
VPPDRFEFTADPDTSPTQSVAATHPVALFIGVDGGSLTSVVDPSIQIAGPPGLAVAREPQYIYEFKVGVLAYPPRGRGRARRGVEVTLSQRSRTLATFRFVTSCSAPIGGLQCSPLPKEAPRR